MKVVAIRSLAQWADAIAALDAGGRLAERVALVPSEAHAHALRVALVERAPHALAGTRFLNEAAAARAVLDAAGVAYEADESQRRPLRVRALLRGRPVLASYRADDLQTPGWQMAIATTIEQLEAGALRPDDLAALGDPRAADLATLWRWLDADAGSSWTVPRLMCEAARRAWPFDGPVLAVATSYRDVAAARLITALPRLTLGVMPDRPSTARSRDRMRALFGEAAVITASEPTELPRPRELDLLAAHLFASTAPGRRRVADGTVSLELHAGTDDELDAAAHWVADQVLHGTPLQDLAVLAPSPEPLATLVADRLAALPWPTATPVYLASGRPAVTVAAGAQLRAVLRALEAGLPRDAVTALLPRLRRAAGDRDKLSPGAARAWVSELGTAGGDPAEWRDRLRAHADDHRTATAGPALDALVEIASLDAPIASLWPAIQAFATQHLVGSRELAAILDQLDDALDRLIRGGVTASLTGREALTVIDETLGALRLEAGRYGEPSIYVGTVQGAAGLPFAAVRVIGLVESIYPGTLRGDPLLPPELRQRLPAHAVASDAEFAAMRLHMLGEVVRSTAHQLTVSAARTEGAGSEREPAGLFVDFAAALGLGIPTSRDLERDVFEPARAAALARPPVFASCWLDRVARGARPPAWASDEAVAPSRTARTIDVPGLDPAHPISALALRSLLACPHRFLLERVLGRRPRVDPPDVHRIAPATYGDLLHRVVQAFLVAHGAAFTARSHDLAYWQACGERLADEALDALLASYPLRGQPAIDDARRRLHRDLRTYLTDDWAEPSPRRWVDAERSFEVAIDTAAGALYVHGRIDRIDVVDGVTHVRDLKTTRLQRKRMPAEPTPAIDAQLAVYVAATERLAAAWDVPATVAGAYTYIDARATERCRAFPPRVLTDAAQRWFELAAGWLREGRFVRTSDSDVCRHCPFAAACDGADPTQGAVTA